MTTNASILHVHADQTIKAAHGNDVTLTIEFRSAAGEFDPGPYYLDIEPKNSEIKTIRSHGSDVTADVTAEDNSGVQVRDFDRRGSRPEDRIITLPRGLSNFRLDITFATATLVNNSVNIVNVFLRHGADVNREGPLLAEVSVPLDFTQSGGAAPVRVVSKTIVGTQWTDDVVLFALIKKGAERLSFDSYQKHMNFLLCGAPLAVADDGVKTALLGGEKAVIQPLGGRRFLPFNDTDAYRLLKVATEAFVAVKSVACPQDARRNVIAKEELEALAAGINADNLPDDPLQRYTTNYLRAVNGSPNDVLPYYALIAQKLSDSHLKESIFPAVAPLLGDKFQKADLGHCTGILRRKLTCPIMIELIWSYWHEQGMQVQSMFALRDRFQNRRSGATPDPLAVMEMGYLRPLNNIFWGYIQDEQHRLTLARRVYEYDHHYGLTLMGTAVPSLQPVDSRSKFLEAFHNLLYISTIFFKEDDDTNRKADAFPILNAIKEVHFLLSEGAHNQYGDLPTTSRIEMLMEQWLLARPELQQFLPARESIAYPEAWMGTVDAMKTVQGWTNTSVMYFHDLAVFGEQILLSIRFNNWSQIFDRTHAANWARVWRSEIQAYMHAYRTVTSVDLTIEPTEPRLAERKVDPSVLLARRMEEQKQLGAVARGVPRLPASPTAGLRLPPRSGPR
jgi:hypothetical protein